MRTRIGNRTTRIGLTFPIRTLAAAVSVLICQAVALADGNVRAVKERAIDWATDERRVVFDRIMPAASRSEVRDPVCRVTTLRSPGAIDSFEFSIRIVERCDEVVTGEVSLPRGEPLTVQLAKLRIERQTIPADDVINWLRIDRRALSATDASKILQILRDIQVSPVASNELLMDRRRFELSSASWTFVHLEFLDIERRRGWKLLPKAVHSIFAIVGIREGDLRYDPHELENDSE